MTTVPESYNPLDKDHLAESIAGAFFKCELHKLPPMSGFTGAGIYAIYYGGDYPLYAEMADSLKFFEAGGNKQPIPVYIGKSDPPGSRKGVVAAASEEEAKAFLAANTKHNKLYARLKKHGTSISAAKNLSIDDFKCRYMLVDEIWVALGEARLLALFRPIWNGLVEGFGGNVEGEGRESTARPIWDILHPGRKDQLAIQVDPKIEAVIVDQLRSSKTVDELKSAIKTHREARIQFAKKRKQLRKISKSQE